MISVFYYHNGLKIYYEEIGKGDPIVFLHGWGCSSNIFRPIAVKLSKKYCVYLVDLPGFGKSCEPNEAQSVKEVTNVIDGLIKSIGLYNIILVGHSYGGRVAAEYAAEYGNVKKLILIDSAGIKRFSLKKFLKVRIYKFKKWFYRVTKNVMKYNNLVVSSGSTDYVNASMVKKKMLIYAVNYDQRRIFKKIKCETLLIWGRVDKSTPLKDGKLIHKLIENSEIVVIPGSGHFPFLDNYYYFIRVFEEYLGV